MQENINQFKVLFMFVYEYNLYIYMYIRNYVTCNEAKYLQQQVGFPLAVFRSNKENYNLCNLQITKVWN